VDIFFLKTRIILRATGKEKDKHGCQKANAIPPGAGEDTWRLLG
jgi:hypothetical protein